MNLSVGVVLEHGVEMIPSENGNFEGHDDVMRGEFQLWDEEEL